MEKKIKIISISILSLLIISGLSNSLASMNTMKPNEDIPNRTAYLENRCAFSGNCSSCVVNSPLLQIIIPSSGIAKIKFSTRYEILPIDGPDYGYVKLSDDGGNTWRIMRALQGFQPNWTEVEFDMFQWVGPIIIMFEYYTFSAFTVSRGWYIDSIIAEGFTDEGSVIVYSEDFEEYGINERWGDWTVSKMPGEEDTTPPDTFITDGPMGSIDYDTMTFKWIGEDAPYGTPAWDLVYSYLLDGYNSLWSPWTLDVSKTYYNLPNGQYTFKVKAKDLANNMDPTPAERQVSISVKEDSIPPVIEIMRPEEGCLYIADMLETKPFPRTRIIGKISVTVDAYDLKSAIEKVEFYVDDKLKFVDNEIPYEWLWDETVFWHHTLKTIAYDEYGNAASDELDVIISNVKLL